MQYKHVTLSVDGLVAVLKLDDAAVMNALSPEMMDDLFAALDAVAERNVEVRCLVITGAGRAFCTGVNLQTQRGDVTSEADPSTLLTTVYHPFLRRLRDLHCPIVTSVNGPAAGAGVSLAMVGDMIVCARSAYFLQAFRHVGVVPDCGSTWLMPRLVGKARSMELSLLGDKLPAEKALEWGLVNRVFDDDVLSDETMKLARKLASGPTVALSFMRKLHWSSSENSFDEQLDLERQSQGFVVSTHDFKEGVAAFIEKRRANFEGR